MKHTLFYLSKKIVSMRGFFYTLAFLLLIISIYNISDFLITVKASSYTSKTQPSDTVLLTENITLKNEILPEKYHYYCLKNTKAQRKIQVQIHTSEKPEFAFQMYTATGALYTPDSYEYSPSSQTLKIVYVFSTNKNYLLRLTNTSVKKIPYTIYYEEIDYEKKEKAEESFSKKTSKSNQASSKKTKSSNQTSPKKSTKPISSSSQKKLTKPISSSSQKTMDQQSSNSSNKTQKISTKKKSKLRKKTISKTDYTLMLSDSFLCISRNEYFSLSSYMKSLHQKKGDTDSSDFNYKKCSWKCSSPSLIKNRKVNFSNKSCTFSAKANKSGILNMVCHYQNFTASCTIKIKD